MPHCPVCGNEISRQTTEQILQHVLALKPEDRIMVLAPVVRGRKGEYKKDLEKLARQGFVRARIDGVLRSLDEDIALDKRKNHTIEVVVDRLLVKPGIEKRLEASIETATKLADGLVLIVGGQRRGAAVLAEAGLHGVRHAASRSWSRDRSRSTVRMARARRATGWAASGASTPRRSSSTLPSRCSTAASGAGAQLHPWSHAAAARGAARRPASNLKQSVRGAAQEDADLLLKAAAVPGHPRRF